MFENILKFDEFVLNEGLLKTYPIDKVIKYIQNRFNITDDDVEKYVDGYGEYILVRKNQSKDVIDNIKQILDLGGYYLADEDIDEYYTYEKKFEDNIFDELKKSGEIKYLYHITPSINDKKIQSNGLIPKSKNYRFNYPDRIYFLSDKDVNKDPEILKRVGWELYKVIFFKNRTNKEYLERRNSRQYSIYRINFSKLENIDLYRDPNTRNFDSYFTMDNIRPEWIEKIDEFSASFV